MGSFRAEGVASLSLKLGARLVSSRRLFRSIIHQIVFYSLTSSLIFMALLQSKRFKTGFRAYFHSTWQGHFHFRAEVWRVCVFSLLEGSKNLPQSFPKPRFVFVRLIKDLRIAMGSQRAINNSEKGAPRAEHTLRCGSSHLIGVSMKKFFHCRAQLPIFVRSVGAQMFSKFSLRHTISPLFRE